jgi:hypothetical protein
MDCDYDGRIVMSTAGTADFAWFYEVLIVRILHFLKMFLIKLCRQYVFAYVLPISLHIFSYILVYMFCILFAFLFAG